MGEYIWLSYPLDISGPRPPAIPKPKLSVFLTIAEHGASVQVLEVASHTGTHIDSPLHVIEGGLSIHDFGPEEFIFTSPVIIDLPLNDAEIVQEHHLKHHESEIASADIVLFRFGYGLIHESDPKRYGLRSPGFGIESARYLRNEFPRLRAIGMDIPSLACIDKLDLTMQSHHVLLEGDGRRFIIIEEMRIPEDVKNISEVRLYPWLVKGMDSGPCTIVAYRADA